MAARLTTFSKLLITLIVVAGIGFLIIKLSGNSVNFKDTINFNPSKKSSKRIRADIKVGMSSWGGYAPGLYFNNGFLPNEDSRFTKLYDIDVAFRVIDDSEDSREAWKAGEVDLISTTVDALAANMESLKEFDPRIVFLFDWSRGGDVLITRDSIENIAELKGKRIVFTEGSPSSSLYIDIVDNSSLNYEDVQHIKSANIKQAATLFLKNDSIDAAIVRTPDEINIQRLLKEAKIIASTADRKNIIADVFIAKKRWIDEHAEELDLFYEGWMIAAAEINKYKEAKAEVAELIADGVSFSKEEALIAINNVRLTTHGDNEVFFIPDTDSTNSLGENLYNNTTANYIFLGLAKVAYKWDMFIYTDAIQNFSYDGFDHSAESKSAQ